MKKIVIASLNKNAGKTTVALAIALKSKARIGYMKPFGDNPYYKEKKLSDYDAFLFKELFGIENAVEEFCIGLHHSKIAHFYENIEDELLKRYEALSKGKEMFIIESNEYIWRGASIKLDAFSISEILDANLIFVLNGDYHEIMDKVHHISRMKRDAGIILNMVKKEDAEKIKEKAEEMGLDYFGYIPYIEKLKAIKVKYVAEKLFAKVIAGEDGLDKYIENIFIAALSAPEIKRHPDFKKRNKLIITGGDRSDVIAACIENGTSCIILTNNIIPSANIIAKANEKEIPLLSLRPDTYTVAKLVENIQPVILPDEKEKIEEIKNRERISMERIT